MNRLTKLRTFARLGPTSIARVAVYRLGLRTGRHPVQQLVAPIASPPFFRAAELQGQTPPANTAWDDTLWRFGWHRQLLPDGLPDWFDNPFSNAPQPDATCDWWRIPDFGAGDIKGLWELSRLDWLVAWATKAAQGDMAALDRLNLWLADWALKNPPYKGPNWKCGQEASIRVMHLVVASWVLGQDNKPEQGLVDLLAAHLRRIEPTMSYAIGQQNNHGTSEAAALFIGGSFLEGLHPRADAWARKGRRWLEERAAVLIERDGSFSQYSVNYHRVTLDSYALAEAWRSHRALPAFSDRLLARLGAAAEWLWTMTVAETGDAPNTGANDGARLMQLSGTDFRDFRPSVQLAAALFRDVDAFGEGPWTAPLRWLGVPDGASRATQKSASFDDGGYHVLRCGNAMALLRYPRFRFRPSQADALHVDLWHKGLNILRDGGTFSYNAEGAEWFSGTAAHNTVTFDRRDQMLRLGRFLFGNWLEAEAVEMVRDCGKEVFAAAGYTDAQGARHRREISLGARELVCRDTLSGRFRTACLRWRLAPLDWELDGSLLKADGVTVSILIDGTAAHPTIGTTAESRYYQHQARVPLVSVNVDRPCTLTTHVAF